MTYTAHSTVINQELGNGLDIELFRAAMVADITELNNFTNSKRKISKV